MNVSPRHDRSNAAFTMVEVAIALAVIGFALVAIVGILPAGLNVQRENKEETIVNGDGPFILDAIRNGMELDTLTNHVVKILVYSQTGLYGSYSNFSSGHEIVGMMGIPKGAVLDINGPVRADRVVAIVRSLSGAAADQAGAGKDLAFNYHLTSEVVPFQSPLQFGQPEDQKIAVNLQENLSEIRLTLRWPVLPTGEVAAGATRKVFRTIVAGRQTASGGLYFFEPENYRRIP